MAGMDRSLANGRGGVPRVRRATRTCPNVHFDTPYVGCARLPSPGTAWFGFVGRLAACTMALWLCLGCSSGTDHAEIADGGSDAALDVTPLDAHGQSDAQPDTSADALVEDGIVGDAEDANGADMDAELDAGPACAAESGAMFLAKMKTTIGEVVGENEQNVAVFRGVPFARPPVGELRWAPPEPMTCQSEPIDATQFGHACPQIATGLNGLVVEGNEDCLTLNMWVPHGKPPEGGWRLLVFIHGGGNVAGSAVQTLPGGHLLYDGLDLAQRDQIVVTLNYRLGPLGYLALDEAEVPGVTHGNFGLLDQLLALKWLHDNMAAFGGSPDDVTIVGESAGGVNVCALLATERGRTLVRSGVIQSAFCLATPLASARAAAVAWRQAMPCQTGDAKSKWACLRATSAEDLLLALPPAVNIGNVDAATGDAAGFYGPIVDGALLTESPLLALPKLAQTGQSLIVGSNAHELAALLAADVKDAEQMAQVVSEAFAGFGATVVDDLLAMYSPAKYASPQAALVQLFSDQRFTCPTRLVARVAADAGVPTWRYFFDRVPDAANSMGATHGIELVYLFNTLDEIPFYSPTGDELATSNAMMTFWTQFVVTGDPRVAGWVTWPPYESQTDPILRLNATPTVDTGIKNSECDLWESIYQ